MSVLGFLRLASAGTILAGSVAVAVAAPADAGSAPAGQRDVRPAARYVPPAGPSFNNPIGTASQQRALLQQVIRTTNSAPPGSTIRMAVFSFGDPRTADALIAAHRRGVRVRMVFAGENVYPAMERLRQALGTNTGRPSYVRICHDSCRGAKGEMHAKYFSFSGAGDARWITMVGSVNLTQHNAQDQWNDLYTRVGDRRYFRAYGHWFHQLTEDQPVADEYLHKSVGSTDIRFLPLDPARSADPVLSALDKVQCVVGSGDQEVRTTVAISTHAWNEDRGKEIAWKVAGLRGDGCHVRVFYGTGMGAAVKSILESHGVGMREGTHSGVRTHEKVMVVSGSWDGEERSVHAWTGSQNWSDRALHRDDLFVRVDDPDDAGAYARQLRWMWDHG